MILGVVILLVAWMLRAFAKPTLPPTPTTPITPTTPTPVPMSEAHWNFNSYCPAEDVMNVTAQQAFNELVEFIGGRFTITIYPKGSLGFSGPEIADDVGKGLVPISEMWPAHVAGTYPFLSVLGLPALYDRADVKLNKSLINKLWDGLSKPLLEDNLYALDMCVLPCGQGLCVNKPLNLAEPKALLGEEPLRWPRKS